MAEQGGEERMSLLEREEIRMRRQGENKEEEGGIMILFYV